MKRIALVALPLVVVGFALLVVLLLARRRGGVGHATESGVPKADEEAQRLQPPGIEPLRGYDELHESELEARHGAVLHVSTDRISVSQV